MTQSTCNLLKQEMESLKSLQKEFNLAYEEAVKTGDLSEAEHLKSEIEKRIKSLREKLHITIESAREILGKDFLGPEAIKSAFGIELETIPPIPFTKEDLETAKKLNQQLILYVDKAKDGKPLTGEKLFDITKNKTSDGKKLFCDTDWYQKEEFFTKETPELRWKLVSKEIIPDSTSKNYLEQTETLIQYIKDNVFKGKPLPKEYQSAIAEFESQKSNISKLIDSDWKLASDMLEKLQITKLTRESPIETIYRLSLNEKTNQERLLDNRYNRTLRRRSDGKFVNVGFFDDDGMGVRGSTPGHRRGILGVSFSRSL